MVIASIISEILYETAIGTGELASKLIPSGKERGEALEETQPNCHMGARSKNLNNTQRIGLKVQARTPELGEMPFQ